MVGPERLELSHRKTLDPKSSASTNFATGPFDIAIIFYNTKYLTSSVQKCDCLEFEMLTQTTFLSGFAFSASNIYRAIL